MSVTGNPLLTNDGDTPEQNKNTVIKEALDTETVKETDKEVKETAKEVKDIEKEVKEKDKNRSVSFNRDVHVKRFGKARELRGATEQTPIRKEPFTHLSEQELINEANKVIAQAQSVTCTADHPPEKFFSLPHRRKLKEERRNSDDITDGKTSLGRSTSDVGAKRKKERTSLSTLFRRTQRNKSPVEPVVVTTKPVAAVKRSKSDVTDLKSNTKLNTQTKPIRKRSGSETEEFLKSLRNKKTQLSPIIESSPRDDYFKKTPPLEVFQKQKLAQRESNKSDQDKDKKVNPVEKPPRFKTPDKLDPKPPTRTKRGKSKEQSPPIIDTPKRKTDVKKILLVDEIDSFRTKDINPFEIKDKIKDSIRKIEENVYADRDMIHSSQQPPDKPPLTRGHTVDHMVRIIREDQLSPPPKNHLISPTKGTSISQPFSYIKPSVSPDGNMFVRNSPDTVPSPVNKMTDKGVVYAQVTRNGDRNTDKYNKNHMPKYLPSREKLGNHSDEDEGLGYEERYKYSNNRNYENDYKQNDKTSPKGYKITDSPIKPNFREFRMTNFEDFEPTYANDYPSHKDDQDFIDKFRGRGDGMDKKSYEPETTKVDLDFNELSHRRQLLESRLKARRHERDRAVIDEPMSRYLMETDPIYEANKKMKATERYVNETARYYRHTLERDGFTENNVTEDYNIFDSDKQKLKYSTESRAFNKGPKDEVDRRDYTDRIEPRFKDNRKAIPPEPEYEPPSLESNIAKPVLTLEEYKDKKYRSKKLTSSHDALQTGQKYKVRDEYFGKRKGHYASNPEITQREEEYANLPKHTESCHNSLRRVKNKDRYKEDNTIRRHDSGDSRDYYDRSPNRFDNRLVDSGIENDFRKDSGEIHRKNKRYESDEDIRRTSSFLDSERRHTEDNYPGEQIYANTEHLKYSNGYKKYGSRDRSDDGSRLDHNLERYEKSPSTDDKLSAKPPKAKKLSGLEKVKQLFSRDSSKKSKKEKEEKVTRTRVLKSPEHLARRDSEYRRYTDPEPSDIIVKKINYECSGDERYRSSRENSDLERSERVEPKYRNYDQRYERKTTEERRYQNHKELKTRYSSERESDRPSDGESELRSSRPRPTGPMDSPALAERYRGRRRLATPSPTPTPSPPRRQATGSWFKSLDRLTRKKGQPAAKVEKDSTLSAEEDPRKLSSKARATPLNSPAKNLRFFGDTDLESDAVSHSAVTKTRSHPQPRRGTLRKTISNSTNGLDEVDNSILSNKSHSLSNLHREDKRVRSDRRNLQNITEHAEDRKMAKKPPIKPHDRSRSQSSSKTLKAEKGADVRRRGEERGSSSELRGSKPDVNRELKQRRRTPATNSGESSTEGDSSHQSQRSVVYLHATTVGDIPDPGRTRHRSRDDVSSVNSSNLQVRSTTKSFSIFAPWTPRHAPGETDVHYAQRPRKPNTKSVKNDRPNTKNSSYERPLQKNKSYSQTTLTKRPTNSRLTSSSQTLYRKDRDAQSTLRKKDGKGSSEVVGSKERVSRSISMPKDNNKKAGWFKLAKNKKPEGNSRVR